MAKKSPSSTKKSAKSAGKPTSGKASAKLSPKAIAKPEKKTAAKAVKKTPEKPLKKASAPPPAKSKASAPKVKSPAKPKGKSAVESKAKSSPGSQAKAGKGDKAAAKPAMMTKKIKSDEPEEEIIETEAQEEVTTDDAAPQKAEKLSKVKPIRIERGNAEDEKAKWAELFKKYGKEKAVSYKMSETFSSLTPLQHKVLGWGFILKNDNDRLEVLFETGIRMLISNYKS